VRPDQEGAATVQLYPIGVIRSPLKMAEGTPIQTAYGCGVEGEVIVDEAFEAALMDI
jgi:tRNA (Thr-GGU) A37 N-methylase